MNEPRDYCPECDSDNLTDFDMAEVEIDGGIIHRYGTFRCLDCGYEKF